MVVGTELAARTVSAACFIRNSSIGLFCAAPTTDMSTMLAPAARGFDERMLPSRFTDADVTPPGPATPWTAETTAKGRLSSTPLIGDG
jgi:hypothetical protein